MTHPARPAVELRSLLPLLAVAAVLALLVVAPAWPSASTAIGWILSATLLLAAATLARALRRSAVDRATLQAQVGRLTSRLAQVATAQMRFVDSVAHEIKTPLTVVLNHAELLLRCSDDGAAVRGHARSLADYTLHYSALLEGFLRLGGGPPTDDHGPRVPVPVNDLVVEAARRSQSLAQGRGVHVVVTVADAGDDSPPLEVAGDETLLEALVESLVRHAVQASWRGARVELQTRAVGDSVLIRVRHHGLAIAAQELGSMFDWFGQPTGPGRPPNGNGGQLAIGKRIVEHHRGTITLHNHAEGGCEFLVSLPRHRGDGPPTPAAPASDRSSPLAGRT